ncbi:UDP-2,3-diacylglucosamine diphosphatase [Ideonella sp. BN130291]|nr:UDP-2,3-diacylglucosamine diphosphatase [Ideonella sp. BN130291]
MAPGQIGRFEAPAHWRAIDFISDLHLDAEHPRTFDAWERQLLHTTADAVWLLGDVFEAWVGDDARHSGFEQRCAQVLKAAAGRRHIAFMAGNRDFLVGEALLADCGMHRLADPTLLQAWGQTLLLTHGDALCIADTEYQRFRAMVRDPAWQQAFLARGLAERQALARQMRDASEANKRGQMPTDWADVDAGTAVQWLQAAGAAQMLHGHTHRPGHDILAPGFERHVLSDWDLDGTHPRAEVLRLTREGLVRLAPELALALA